MRYSERTMADDRTNNVASETLVLADGDNQENLFRVRRTKLLVKDVLQLNQGAVIELTKLAGEPLDIFVNSKLVARGEAVVVNEKFGVRLVDIVSPNERVEKIL